MDDFIVITTTPASRGRGLGKALTGHRGAVAVGQLIFSTDEGDATLFQQDELTVTLASTIRNIPKRLNTLNRLMACVHIRDFGAAPGSDEASSDWTTVEVASMFVRPAEAAVAI